jgi:putative addiction module component, TIGR02574 family
MSTEEVKEYILSHIDDLDEKYLVDIYAMMSWYLENNDFELSKEQKKELDRRIARHERGESKSYTWDEVKARIKSRM